MGRAPCCDKANVKKGPWSPEEDTKLKEYIDKCGTGGNWIALPHKAGLKRCGKSCRLRWLNYLRPNIKHGDFSEDEDRIICSLFASIGSRWSIIAAQLPGRTDNDIKNYWNTKLKKKLLGIPPSQRKPNPQQPQQQFIFQSTLQNSTALPSSTQDSCIYNPSRPLFGTGNGAEGFSLISSDLINTLPQGYHSLVQQHDEYQMKGNGGLLVFNADQQSCSSSDGSCNQNSNLGFEGPLFLAGGDAAAPLEYSYEEMKQLVNPSSMINYLDHDPSAARGDMSLKSHGGRVTYYY